MLENLGPITWAMRISGLYHQLPDEQASKAKRWFSARTYCLVVTVLLWLNLLRYVPVFFMGVIGWNPLELLTFCWFFQGAINATLCFRACSNPKHLKEFDRLWKLFKVDTDVQNVPLVFPKSEMVIWIVICLIYASVFIFLDFFLYGAGGAGIFERGQIWLDTYIEPATKSIYVYVLFMCVELFLCAAWMFPFCLIMLVTIGLYKVASKLEDFIKDDVQVCQEDWPWNDQLSGAPMDRIPDIATWRYYHSRVCDMVSQLDKDFSMFILSFSFVAIPKTCFITYRLIHVFMSKFELTFHVMNLYWLVFTVLNITCVLLSATILHKKLCSPLKYLPRLIGSYGEKDQAIAYQTQLLLLRMKGAAQLMGFSLGGIFVVSEAFILTTVGIYGTFIFLVIEFEFELMNNS
ncbi:hypothetical protein CAPTEDRAFT_221497 [Capitella teleta]|uniref:Odorant receptor n=1 Tax=Capitella teleta TaxID=283909 RepID=R7VGJ8_CAPTE|nr:hypothetical protein CAPTEDRAFT_221497 [Capitella teleta]|eukprot:ELU17667.1 hypothetical protein CAPTEDRAFT_221497 [Capitella teleta]